MAPLTITGRLLLVASLLVGLAAVLWPSGDRTETTNLTNNDSCPLGFTSTVGEKGRWRTAIHHLHVTVRGPALRAGHPSIGAIRNGRTKPPDTRYHLFHNATIWIGEERLEPRQAGGFAEALLVREGGVVAVGALADVRAALPTDTTDNADAAAGSTAGGVVEHDMGGSFLMPGFVDAHVHVLPAGLSLSRVDLGGAASRGEFQERVAAVAAHLGPTEWLLGGQWDEGEWGGEMPSAEWLDQGCGGRPAYLTRHDLHMALANSAALALAGVGPDTPDPDGGTIDRDSATGRPTGLLRERAMALVESVILPPSVSERQAALAAATRHALSRGVTTLVDMGRYLAGEERWPWLDLQEVYMPAADSGDLAVRVFAVVPLRSWARLAAWVAAHGRAHPSGRLFWGGLKEFADGSLGSRTALLWEPYADSAGGEAAGECGQRGLDPEELRQLTEAAVQAGLQVCVHAIGDRAVDDVVGSYEAALAAVVRAAADSNNGGGDGDGNGGPGEAALSEEERRRRLGHGLRLRVEHVQHLSGSDNATAAIARNGLTAVPNPLHLLTDAAMLGPRLGPDRAARAFALASLRRAGLRPALASDWPVVDLQPLTGVYAAVHRHAPPPAVACAAQRKLPPDSRFAIIGAGHVHDGDDSCDHDAGGADAGRYDWPPAVFPEERLSLEEALLGHTTWGAAAAGLDDYVGRLAPGLRADFVELSDSLAEEVETGEGTRQLRLSEELLRRRLPVVTRTWLDGELVYDLDAVWKAEEVDAWAVGGKA